MCMVTKNSKTCNQFPGYLVDQLSENNKGQLELYKVFK